MSPALRRGAVCGSVICFRGRLDIVFLDATSLSEPYQPLVLSIGEVKRKAADLVKAQHQRVNLVARVEECHIAVNAAARRHLPREAPPRRSAACQLQDYGSIQTTSSGSLCRKEGTRNLPTAELKKWFQFQETVATHAEALCATLTRLHDRERAGRASSHFKAVSPLHVVAKLIDHGVLPNLILTRRW